MKFIKAIVWAIGNAFAFNVVLPAWWVAWQLTDAAETLPRSW